MKNKLSSITNFLIVSFSILILFTGCEKEEKPRVVKPLYEINAPKNLPLFDGENAYKQVEKIISFGPRNPNSTGNKNVLNYLQRQLSLYADEVSLQSFSYTGYDDEHLALSNVIAKFNPESKNRIIISAHWDSRPRAENAKDTSRRDKPILGANDGASGCGVMLELARLIKQNNIQFGVDLIFFDGEDYGKRSDLANFCLGTKYFASHLPNGYQPAFAILLDMVGDKNAFFPKEGYSLRYASDVVSMIWGIAQTIGSAAFTDKEGGGIYDDHIPLNQAGIKAIDIIDLELVGADTPDERRNYWHTHRDNMDNISAETLQQVGDVLTYLIFSLNFNS